VPKNLPLPVPPKFKLFKPFKLFRFFKPFAAIIHHCETVPDTSQSLVADLPLPVPEMFAIFATFANFNACITHLWKRRPRP
jgi:hypothetical protein